MCSTVVIFRYALSGTGDAMWICFAEEVAKVGAGLQQCTWSAPMTMIVHHSRH